MINAPRPNQRRFFVPLTLTGILIATTFGVVAPGFVDVETDSLTRRLVPVALAIVAISGIATTRLYSLPRTLDGQVGETGAPILVGERGLAATAIACSFSVAPSIYGVVATIFADSRLYAVGFAALSVLSLAIYVPYVNGRIEELDSEARSRGEA